jgi:alkylation response protein AidB-like acyl-CoA dehydrogenase
MSEINIEEIKAELSEWIQDNWDPDMTVSEWWKRLSDAGWSATSLPVEAGGRGWGRSETGMVKSTLFTHDVIGPPTGLGMMLAAPTIATHGNPDQIERLIPPIIDGSIAWCQLFSEPGAGSDLAGLQTRAVKDGDEWIITGQKVWTSGGHLAEKGMLIARTDIDAPKHQGITYFAFDMDQPGVEVRPLKEMTGRALFNEVFIDEARVSNDDVIGGIGNGWAVANTTLMVERSSLGSGGPEPVAVPAGGKAGRLERKVGEYVLGAGGNIESDGGRGLDVRWLSDLAQKVGSAGDPVVRQEIIKLHILGEVNRLNMLRAKAGGSKTGAEGNLAKLAMSELVRRSRDVGNLIIGADGMLSSSSSSFDGRVQEATIFSPAPSIYGGTDQVQRNIVGERVLGLPKEPGPNKETPFKELLQN